jgi:hypothetical protein
MVSCNALNVHTRGIWYGTVDNRKEVPITVIRIWNTVNVMPLRTPTQVQLSIPISPKEAMANKNLSTKIQDDTDQRELQRQVDCQSEFHSFTDNINTHNHELSANDHI